LNDATKLTIMSHILIKDKDTQQILLKKSDNLNLVPSLNEKKPDFKKDK